MAESVLAGVGFEQQLRIIQLAVATVNSPQQTTSICLLVAREGREEGEFIWGSLSLVTCSNLNLNPLLQILECRIE